MFSGKTEELIRRMKRAKFAKQRVEIFKPAIDTRYSEEDVSSVFLFGILRIVTQQVSFRENSGTYFTVTVTAVSYTHLIKRCSTNSARRVCIAK